MKGGPVVFAALKWNVVLLVGVSAVAIVVVIVVLVGWLMRRK